MNTVEDLKRLQLKAFVFLLLLNWGKEYGEQVKDNAAKCFLDSANYLGLLSNGVLCMDNVGEQPQSIVFSQEEQSEKLDSAESLQEVNNFTHPQEEGYLFEIPTMGKKTARFYIPDGVTEKDIDYIKLYIEKMLPVFLDNLKTEL